MKSPDLSSKRNVQLSSRAARSVAPLKNIRGVTHHLLGQIALLSAGRTNPASLNAVTNATGKFLSAIRLQLEYAKQRGVRPHIPEIGDSK